MEGAELALTAVRGVQLAASLAAFGVAVFWSVVAAPVLRAADVTARRRFEARSRRLFRAAVGLALAAGAVWLVGEAAYISEAASLADTADAVWPVLTDTRFGHILGARLLLLGFAWPALGDGARGWRRAVAAGAAGLAIALQPWSAHAAAAGGTDRTILLAAECLHLLAAGAWLGALPALFMLVGVLPPDPCVRALHRFSPLGLFCVTVIAATALAQGWLQIGGLPGLLGTDYGRVALAKLVLFLAMLWLAAANRFRHAPALRRRSDADTKRRLRRSIFIETALGLAVVFAAALLANLPPALHEQPVWPFARQLNLAILGDPDFGPDVRTHLLGLGAAVLVAVVGLLWGLFWRRVRWPALIVAAAIGAWAVSPLDLLFVQAYPTSFYRSPTGFAANSIAQGAALFPVHCSGCHGAVGRGDGPDAKSLPIPPADLTAAHLWYHSDGELFWWLSHGMTAPRGGLAMPGFADSLSEDERWALIDYLHAHNAGMTMAATGRWDHPVLAPDITATCADGRKIGVADLGQVVRLVGGDGNDMGPAAAKASLTTILLTRDGQARPAGDGCVSRDAAAWTAYAIVGGVDADGLAGTQFLVDPQGWLRARWRPGDPPGWTDPTQLPAEIEQLLGQPIAMDAGRGRAHH